ncbi:MAG: M48 family metalloprotease [Aquimonas sp.]|nr:M48 family metalloprotease [Aquimonas sp.]
MDRRHFLFAAGAFGVAGFAQASESRLGNMLGAARKGAAAASLSDEDVRAYGAQMVTYADAQHRVAPAGNSYAQRLATITRGLEEDNGLRMNYKVYLDPQINAMVTPDGSVRVYSGLLDAFTDDEIRFVMGHEIGHVAHNHTRKRLQTALAASAARDAAASSGSGRVAQLADSQLGGLLERVVAAQHSQGNEREADDYGMQFMARRNYDRKAAVSALDKMAAMGGGGVSWLSTHPDPKRRADRMRKQVG